MENGSISLLDTVALKCEIDGDLWLKLRIKVPYSFVPPTLQEGWRTIEIRDAEGNLELSKYDFPDEQAYCGSWYTPDIFTAGEYELFYFLGSHTPKARETILNFEPREWETIKVVELALCDKSCFPALRKRQGTQRFVAISSAVALFLVCYSLDPIHLFLLSMIGLYSTMI